MPFLHADFNPCRSYSSHNSYTLFETGTVRLQFVFEVLVREFEIPLAAVHPVYR